MRYTKAAYYLRASARWLRPKELPVEDRNILYFSIDTALQGLMMGGIFTFISVFVVRLNASKLMVSLLASLPAIVLMAVLSLVYLKVKDHPKVNAALRAARPAVIGLLIWTAYDLGTKVLASEGGGWSGVVASWDRYLLTIGAFVAVTFLKVHPALVILVAAVIGFAVY